MAKLFYRFRKFLYLIIILILQTAIWCGQSIAQRWVIHNISQVAGISINDMLLDQHGEIWIATENGIGRFNGTWFRYQEGKGLTSNGVRAIAQDSTGNILFGTAGGVSIVDPINDLNDPANWVTLTVINTDSGLVSDQISSILADSKNNIWFGTDTSGISVLSDRGDWIKITMEDGLRSNKIITMAMDSYSNIWICTMAGIDIYETESQKIKYFTWKGEYNDFAWIIFKDMEGNMWFGTKFSGIYKVYPNNLEQPNEHYTTENGLAENTVRAIIQDKEGAVWFGHEWEGVSMIFPNTELDDPTNWKNFRVIDGLAGYTVSSIIEDLEENMWFGHLRSEGISQFDRTWLSLLSHRKSETNFINGLFIDNKNNLWIATDSGAVRVDLDENLMLNKSTNELFFSEMKVYTIFQDSQMYIWFGTNKGIKRVAGDSIRIGCECQSFLNGKIINWITEDKSHNIWIGTWEGIWKVDINSPAIEDNWLKIEEEDGLISDQVRTILCDTDGYLWIGTNYGLSFFNSTLDPKMNSNWVNYDTSDGLIHNIVTSIYEDGEGNIWFGTRGGISKADRKTKIENPEKWINYTTDNGLASNFVTSISQLKENELWFGTEMGASKFEMGMPSNKWTTYTTSSGLKSNRITSLLADTLDGDIWFGTGGGGVTRYRQKSRPPETFLDTKYDTIKYDIVTENQVEFSFHGIDMVTQEKDLHYQYKLDNQDWIETFNPSVTVFIEDFEKPQSHKFQVRAIDGDGNIDPTPAKNIFYKIDSKLGGNIELLTDPTQSIRLLVPPGVLFGDRSLDIKPLKKYELSDTSDVVIAYEIIPQPKDFDFDKPATLAISFKDSINYNRNQMTISRLDINRKWIALGGTIETKFDTITINTAIKEFGIYAVRCNSVDSVMTPEEKLNIQPRIFSPGAGGKGHGDRATISFFLNNNANTTMRIYNISGRLKRVLLDHLPLLAGTNAVDWNGKDDHGNVCPTGLYIVTIEAEGKVWTKTVMVSNKYKK